jgi:hypothetical protein
VDRDASSRILLDSRSAAEVGKLAEAVAKREMDFTKARVRRNPYAARIAKDGITG